MSIEQHRANRTWAFDALDTLRGFVSDGDFEGIIEQDKESIEHKRRSLIEGKYRTLILGAFNVGKSTLINAYLGDEYLPTILEECTTKLTHVIYGDTMKTVLAMQTPATESELQALRDVHSTLNILADVSQDSSRPQITVAYPEHNPRSVNGTLKTLITMGADEDFPALATLRSKFEELFVYLPNGRLADDIALIDSPGVHSIIHTNNRIAREVVPSSHLVICMLDSQNAGNEQSRDFIANVIQPSNRKVFFVINKADYLADHEIDPTGHRGPGKDLVRSLQGVVKSPEIFFVSSLYALMGEQLDSGRISLAEVEANQKIRIPYSIQTELHASPDPAKATAQYLLARSGLKALRERMLEYLYTENVEGAVVDSVCMWVDQTAWKYTRPLEMKLEQAKNIPKLEDLAKNRERLEQQLAILRSQIQKLKADCHSRQSEYQTTAEGLFSKQAIEEKVLKPIRTWLDTGDNLKTSKKQHYKPLATELEQLLAKFIDDAEAALNSEVDAVERQCRAEAQQLLGTSETWEKRGSISASRTGVVALSAEMGKSFLRFGLTGAVLGGAVLGGAGFAFVNDQLLQSLQVAERLGTAMPPAPQFGALAGALVGILAGGLLGLIVRAAGSDAVRKERLNKAIAEKVEQMLHKDVLGQFKDAIERRRASFSMKLNSDLDKAVAAIQDQIQMIRNEEEALKQMQAGTIERIGPKLETLSTLSKKAREILQWGAAKKGRN